MSNTLPPFLMINTFGILAAISAILALAVALFASILAKTSGGRLLALINYSLATWSFFSALNYLSVDLAAKTLWLKLAYPGALSLPVFLLLFALDYYGSVGWFHWKRISLLFIIPLISWLLILTNEWHHLVYAQIATSPTSPFLQVSPVWYFWVGVAGYSYLLIFFCVAILVQVVWQSTGLYRPQIILLIFSILIPVAGNVFFLLKLLPTWLDPTFILLSTCVLFALGIFRFQLLDLVPFALRQVVERLDEVVLVLDQKDRLVYMNLAAERLLGQEPKKLIGQPAIQALPALAAIVERDASSSVGISLVSSGSVRHCTVEISTLYDTHQVPSGQVIILNDITILKQAQDAFQRAAITEERERMAQEVLGNLGEVLSDLFLSTQSIRDQIEQGSYNAAFGHLESLSLIAQSASQDVRQFILDTQPQVADGRSFSVVLKEYLKYFETSTGLRVQLSLPHESFDSLLSQENFSGLLRIIQEVLANVRKHARARLVQIIFSFDEYALAVVIFDDGVGFDKRSEQGGFGLEMIDKLVQQFGATVVIRSAVQQGTQVLLKFPRLQQKGTYHDQLGSKVPGLDDHPLFAEGIVNFLASRGLDVIGITRDGH
ncbi:MAG: histidine kinase N-terminal 7TM domain-containing protein [Chloroflexota bacterium]